MIHFLAVSIGDFPWLLVKIKQDYVYRSSSEGKTETLKENGSEGRGAVGTGTTFLYSSLK